MAQTALDEQLEKLAPPKQQVADDPLLEALKETHTVRTGGQSVRMSQNIKAAADTTPDRAAEVKRLSEKTGLPPTVIERNFEDIQKRAKVADTPYAQMQRETPHLADQLANDPDTAPVAHDDLEQLGFLEWMVTAPQRAYAQSVAQQRVASLQTQRLFRELNQEELDSLNSEKFYSNLGGALGAGDSWWRQSVTSASQLLANVTFGATRASKGAAIGAGAGAVIGGAAGFASTGGPGVVPGAIKGGRFGATAGAAIEGARYGFELEAGLAYDEFLEFKDENGKTIDPQIAKAAAFAAGGINAGIEVLQLEKLAKTIPGFSKLEGAFTRNAVKQALKNPTVRAALGEAMKSYAGTLTFETATEVGQRAVTILAGELGKAASGAERLPLKAIGQDLVQEGIGAAQGFALIGAAGPTMSATIDSRRARQAQANADWFKALGEGVANSKTHERAPAVVEQLIRRATEKGPIPNVYAPADTWRTYWQSKKEDPAKMAAEVTGRADALEVAEAQGIDIEIPTARYASKLAATEHNEFFAQELRLAPEEMNTREAQAWQDEQLAAQQVATETAADQEKQTARAQVREQVVEQLVAGGRYTRETAVKVARLAESAFGQMAEDAGVDPFDVYRQYGLRVERPAVGRAPVETPAPAPAAAPTPAPVQPTLEEEIPGLADLEASLGGDQVLETVEDAQATTQENASGDSAASLEALSRDAGMRSRGEQFGVYDRAGRFRPLIGPDAVDYEPLRGETYGIQSPTGFRPLTDRGGRVPSYTSEAQVNAEPVAERGPDTGEQLPGSSRELPATDEGGTPEGASDGGSAERSRLPTSLELDDLTAYPQGFKPAEKAADLERLTEPVRNELGRILQELEEFGFQPNTWHWLPAAVVGKPGNAAGGAADIIPGAAGSPIHDDILNYSPLNAESQKSVEAEKGDTIGTVAERTGFTVAQLREVNDFGRRTNLKEGEKVKLPRGAAKTVDATRQKVAEAVKKLISSERIHNNLAEGAVRVAERRAIQDYRDISRPTIAPSWGVIADRAFTDELSASIDDAVNEGAIEADEQLPEGAGDFDISEFGQDLIDMMNAALPEEQAADEQLAQQRAAEQPAKKADPLADIRAKQQAHKDQVAAELKDIGDADTIVLEDPQGRKLAITPSVREPGKVQLTRFMSDGTPAGHDNYPTTAQAYESARGLYGSKTYGPAAGGREYALKEIHDPDGTVRAPAVTEKTVVDTLDTGEQQPRLPEAGKVREQNVETPTFEVPFTLTSETSKAKKGKQTELFQEAWHGSPHIFDAFSLHAIGTGEGAQAYGWGLYFASRREVAEYYRENLAGEEKPVFTALSPEENNLIPQWTRQRIANSIENPFTKTGTRDAGMQELMDAKAGFEKTIAEDTETLRPSTIEEVEAARAKGWGNLLKVGEPKTLQPWLVEERIRHVRRIVAVLDKLANADGGELFFHREKPGRVYKVEIPEDDQMLDWDVPASKQPPKVQAALNALGVKWEPFKVKTLGQMRQWLNGPTADRLAREDIGIRESLREAHHFLMNEDDVSLRRWQEQHQGYFATGMTDPTGEVIYGNLQTQELVAANRAAAPAPGVPPATMMPYKEGQRLASERLAKAGIVGLRYLDGGSRSRGDGSHNYVVFDDQLVQVQEFFQDPNDLVIAHNLTAANLRHALKLGGLPVPSFAITRKGETSTSYGEITLVGDAAMADPQGYAKTQVFGADVYSPRYPTIRYKIPAAGEKLLSALFKKWKDQTGASYIDLDELQKEGPRYLERSAAPVMAEFLEQQGIPLPAPVLDKGKYARPGQVDTFQSRYALESIIRERGLESEFADYAMKLFESLEPVEKIFKGFTNMGNERYAAHTLENVVKELKKDIRGGESEGNIYGPGQLRAKFTPRFRTINAIRKAKGKLVSREQFDEIKEEVNSEFFEVANSLRPYYEHSDVDSFRFPDTVMAVMEESPKKGLMAALKDYGFADVPVDVRQGISTYIEKLRNLPTEYFEAKILREVDLAEFAGAVVPEGTDPELIKALEARGVTVKTYSKEGGELARDAARRKAVADLGNEQPDRVLFQPERTANKRGSLVIGPGRQMQINLFENADLSTFLHESGHLFLEVMGDLVERVSRIPAEQRTAGQKRIVANYQAALEQLGVAKREDIGVEQHEKFARMFEAYLFEGKAPSLEMRDIFSSFRAWMVSIYRNLRALNAPLNDDVRAVFDRMLANDEAIAHAQAAARLSPMFTTAEMAGMTANEFALYRDTIEKASLKAREELDAKHLGEVRREQEALYKARREEVQAQVEQDFYGRPVYRAMSAIRYGRNPDGTNLSGDEALETPPLKLAKDKLLEQLGADRFRRLPRPVLYTAEGGLDPEFVAERFGFSSADEMIQAIETAEPMRAAIEREVSTKMNQESGLLLDGGIVEAAQQATANEDRELVIRAELRALAKLRSTVAPFESAVRTEANEQLRGERKERAYERRWLEAEKKLALAIQKGESDAEIAALKQEVASLKAKARGGAAVIRGALPPANVVRDVAQERIARSLIKDLNPALYWAAARRASQAALEAAARQDFDAAITAKTQELMATALYREAEKAKADVEKRVQQLRDLSKPKAQQRLGLAGSSYLEQINGILDRFELATIPAKELAKRARFMHWIDGLQAAGATVELEDFPPEIVNDSFKTNYVELSYEGFVGVSDGVKQILHLARLKNKLLKQADAREYSEVRDKVVTSIRENKSARKIPNEFRPSDERRLEIADWFASHTNVATLVRIMDGGQDGGAFWEALVRPMNKAGDDEQARKVKDGTEFTKEVLEKRFKGRDIGQLNQKVFIPAIGGSLSLEGRIAVALNWGNQTSRDRLLADPRRKWTQVQIDAILDTLGKEDWDYVQATWDFIDRYWPEIAAKQERVTGVAPEKVVALEVDTKFGKLRGGYYPLVYDGRLNPRAAQNQAANEAKSLQAAAYVRSTTKRGHVEARKKNVKNSIRLDIAVTFEHIEQVIHDLTHHEFLLDANKLLRDPEIAKAIIETHGDVVLRQLTKAMQDIALGSIPARGIWERSAKWARTGAQIAALGMNLWTAAQQPLGLFNGARRVGVYWVAKGMTRWMRDAASLEATTKWIASVSPFMANRVTTGTQDIAELRSALKKPGGWFDTLVRTVSADTLTQKTITDGYLWHIGVMQRVADVPTWLGAFEKARAQGNDEARAVALADQAVIDSQGSGQLKDLSGVQRGGEMAKLYMAFYSYGATVFNQTRDVLGQARMTPSSIVSTLADLSLIYIMPAIGTAIMANLVGRDDDDDLEDFVMHVAKESLATAMNTMVFLREFGGLLAEGTRGYAGPAGARVFELVYKFGAQVKQGEADEALARATNAVAGVLFRYPATQIQKTVDGWVALEEGKTKNPLALLFGPPPKD